MTQVTLDEETLRRLQIFADHSIARYQNGGDGKLKDWEDARSYAVEVVSTLLFSNPGLCDYRRRFEQIAETRKNPK